MEVKLENNFGEHVKLSESSVESKSESIHWNESDFSILHSREVSLGWIDSLKQIGLPNANSTYNTTENCLRLINLITDSHIPTL